MRVGIPVRHSALLLGPGGMRGIPVEACEVGLSNTWFLAYDLVAGVLCVLGAVITLAFVRPWGRKVPRRTLLVLAWIGGAALLLRGVVGLVQDCSSSPDQGMVGTLRCSTTLGFGGRGPVLRGRPPIRSRVARGAGQRDLRSVFDAPTRAHVVPFPSYDMPWNFYAQHVFDGTLPVIVGAQGGRAVYE